MPLKVVASSLDSLRAEVLSDFACADDLRGCLKASAQVPEIAGPPLVHRGHRRARARSYALEPQRLKLAAHKPRARRARRSPARCAPVGAFLNTPPPGPKGLWTRRCLSPSP